MILVVSELGDGVGSAESSGVGETEGEAVSLESGDEVGACREMTADSPARSRADWDKTADCHPFIWDNGPSPTEIGPSSVCNSVETTAGDFKKA